MEVPITPSSENEVGEVYVRDGSSFFPSPKYSRFAQIASTRDLENEFIGMLKHFEVRLILGQMVIPTHLCAREKKRSIIGDHVIAPFFE